MQTVNLQMTRVVIGSFGYPLTAIKTWLTLLASSDFCRLLITFANSLNPDQDKQNVGPDLDLNHLTL